MKKFIMIALLVSTPALADFDSDFVSFQKDFDRLNNMVVKKKTKTKTVMVKTADDRSLFDSTQDEHEVDPTSPDRLGHQLENNAMREKIAALYEKPDIKVYSYVLQAE